MKSFLARFDTKLRTRIRMIIWKQWKVSERRTINLVRCGHSYDEAKGLANCRRGYMFVAHSKVLQNAITEERLSKPNKKLERRALTFGLNYYLARI